MKVIQVKFAGLFGNQAITYAYCRALAERLGAELQTDPWYGETLFENVKPNLIKEKCDLDIHETWFDLDEIEKADVVRVQYFMTVLSKEPAIDGLAGQHLMHFSKNQLKQYFKFKPEFYYKSPFEKVFHLRFWDPKVSNAEASWYDDNIYPCANITFDSYIIAAKEFGYDLRWFEIVSEKNAHVLSGVPDNLQFIVDFQICTQAKVLFRSNSSFSWLAGSIGDGKVYSPIMKNVIGSWDKTPRFCKFIEGHAGSFWPGGLMGNSELLPN